MDPSFLLIGVDGGATEVKAHEVRCADLVNLANIELGAAAASRCYERLPDFNPVPVADQIAQRDAGAIPLSNAEEKQGMLWLDAAAASIAEVAQASGDVGRAVLVGMGMPGLKTPDRRGIAVINNGPRIPDYLAQLERKLQGRDVRLAAPIAELGSDADYCGLGEEHASGGLFRDVHNAYYIGGGTGLADAIKLRGRLVTFDESREWIMKSWQMPSALGPTFEKLVSARSLNECFTALRGPHSDALFPEECALAGDRIARGLLDAMALVLSELLFERISTLYYGRADAPHRGSGYAALRRDHRFVGTILDRIVIGQRLGMLYDDCRIKHLFADKAQDYLTSFFVVSTDPEFVSSYLEHGKLRLGLIKASPLRVAPAIGAAVAALRAYRAAV